MCNSAYEHNTHQWFYFDRSRIQINSTFQNYSIENLVQLTSF